LTPAVSARGRSRRWILAAAIVAASATALFLGAALADAPSGTGLLLVAAACFGATILIGGAWAASHPTGDPAVDRAETAEHLAEELRGPLVSLRSLSAAGVRAAAELTEEDRLAFFSLIDEEAARMRRSVEGISAALRIEAGGIRYDLREEDLGTLIEESVAEVPTGAHPIHLELEPELRARVDRLRLGEALEIVLDNAGTFSPPDAPIEVRAFRDPDRSVVIEIADHGPGIPATHRPSLFRRGVRWRPAGYEETPGSGVGLFVARAHVTGQGGEILLEDRLEGEPEAEPGTVVRITLPPVAPVA
jgi:signal transduction histidine kinase